MFVHPLTVGEGKQLQGGLRSSDAFVLRRCQILLASARGEHAPRPDGIGVGCDDQTVGNAIRAFNYFSEHSSHVTVGCRGCKPA